MQQSLFLEHGCPDETARVQLLFDKLTAADLWIRVSRVPFCPKHPCVVQSIEPRYKPDGCCWFSRGDWLLHEHGGARDHVTLARARNVRTVTCAADVSAIADSRHVRWAELAKTCAGFAMPVNLYVPNGKQCRQVAGFDVSSLAVWNVVDGLDVVSSTHIPDATVDAIVDWALGVMRDRI